MRFIILFFLGSCINIQETAQIQIKNDSEISVDSVLVAVNNYKFTTGSIAPGKTVNFSFSQDSVRARHDVWYTFKGFVKDSVIFSQSIFSNDLGHVSKSFNIRINDSLQLTEYFIR
jgi:hypothetical protein